MSEVIAFGTGPLTAERIAQFSAALADPNPVHRDPAFCTSIGLPGIIAPGGMAVVAIAHAVALAYGAGAIREIDVTFRSPVQAGESLQCGFAIEGEDETSVTLRCAATGDGGQVRADGIVIVDRGRGPSA